MSCLMPLYGKGLHRNYILRLAFWLNDILSFYRNFGVRKSSRIARGKIYYPRRTAATFPAVNRSGLKGGAVWHDAGIEEFQRLLMELVKRVTACGARCLNYVEVTELLKKNTNVTGVRAVDGETGAEYDFKAPVVINAGGPFSRKVARQLDRDHEPLLKKRLLLWNVLFNKKALSQSALALNPVPGKGRSYFFHPWKERLLVGTGECPVENGAAGTTVPPEQMQDFLDAINKTLPGSDLGEKDIQRVYTGILPAKEDDTLADREVIFEHAGEGGPEGLYSVSGIKFTTSRRVAEKTIKKIFPKKATVSHEELLGHMESEPLSFGYDWEPVTENDFNTLKEIVQNESVLHLGDLILRRTSLGDHPERAIRILPGLKPLFHWDDDKWREEVEQLKRELNTKN